MTDADFAELGMRFKARPLRSAADAYLRHRHAWARLPSDALVTALQSVPYIGPWTAGAAVADYLHDWSAYPYGDLAVRTWARTAAPDTAWPATEREFSTAWRRMCGECLGHLTLFTLAWGGHRADPHRFTHP